MHQKLKVSLSCLCVFILIGWVSAAFSQSHYFGTGIHHHTFGLSEEDRDAFQNKNTNAPLILGTSVMAGETPITFEGQYHTGEGRKKVLIVVDPIPVPVPVFVDTTLKYTLTLLEVQPHLTLREDLSAFLIAGLDSISVEFRAKAGSVTGLVERSGRGNHFGVGLSYKMREKWLLRLALRRMRFPVAEGGDVTNSNFGASILRRF